MKVKELERFAHSAWSPLSHCHSYLATVTAEDNRQSNDLHLDAKITPSTLDIFEFNVKEKSLSMQLNVSLQTKQKGTCLLWTAPVSNLEIGLLIYGSASGSLYLYDSQKIISLHQKSPSHDQKIIDYDDDNCNIDNIYDHSGQTVEHSVFISEFDACSYLYTSRENVHNGVVRSLDFNRFQTNLFASVSNDEEIFIWDIEKMEQPMSPGAKIQPLENLCKVAWNPRVQHILCTTSIGRCVIWDLRKSGPVLQLTKTMCQLEPQIMAWSPDVATRLCIADPNNPNADVQLWDLRYPKHMLALLGHWPPSINTSSPLTGCALGNAGTVNSLSWGIPECQKSMNKSYLYDTDMIVMTIGASGALPTLNGTCGTKLNPTYAEMLVVWSVDQALSSTPDTGTTHEVTPEPIYVGRLEGLDDQELASASSFNELPTNASVHWIPNHPNLICVTQSDGWITVHNLMSGLLKHSDKQIEQVNIERYVKQRALAQNSLGMHTSHKVAEAFDDEQSLISLNDSMNIRNNNNNTNNFESDSLYPVSMGDAGAACIGQQQQHQQQINSLIDQLSNDSSYYLKSPVYSLPQPMPLLRVAPCWLKRPCGAHFAFGGRLVTFSSLTILSSKRTRTLSSMSGKRSDQNRPSEIGIEQSNHQIQPQQQQHQQQSSTLSEYHQSNCGESQLHCVSIKWIDVFQLESSSIESFNSDCSKENKTMKNSIEDIIDCLANVLNCPNEYLITVCERAKELLDTTGNIDCRLSTNSQSNLTLWNVIRARLEEPASVKSSLSSLLGYSKQDYQDFSRCTSNDQLLDALKNALVTGDFISSIRICLHSNFSSLLLPDFSVLNIFAIMLTDSHRSDQPELYNEVQIKLLNMLNDLCLNNKSVNASSSSSSCLNTILMLLNGVLSRNWLNIVNNWPLTDWSTILSTFVNHLWDQDIDLLQSLCSVIVKRLLNNNEGIKNTLSSYDAGLAACICCIISGDLDGLTQYWLNLNNINENRLDDMIKILPLALQLLFLLRISRNNSNHNNDSSQYLQSSKLLINLAIWLADTRGGQNEKDTLLALNLLTKANLPSSTSTKSLSTLNDLIDLRHRLWCNLSLEQQQELSFELRQLLQCPYPQTGCHCGFSKSNSLVDHGASLQQHHVYTQQQSISNIYQAPQNLQSQPQLPSLQSPNFYPPTPSNVQLRNQSSNILSHPLFPPQSMQSLGKLPQQQQQQQQQQGRQYQRQQSNLQQNSSGCFEQNPPSAFNHPSLSGVIDQTKNIQLSSGQNGPFSANSIKPPLLPPSAPINTNFSGSIPPNYQLSNNMPYGMPASNMQFSAQQHQQPSVPLPPPPPTQQQLQQSKLRQAPTSPGWNDPPILSANKPSHPTVSHNPYYNPIEFSNSSLPQLNNYIPQMTDFSKSIQQPNMPPIPPLSSESSFIKSSLLPYPASINNSLPSMNTLQSSSVQQLTTLSTYSQLQGGIQQQEQFHSQFQSSIEQNSQFFGLSSSLSQPQSVVTSLSTSSSSSTVWPAAQPLCSSIKVTDNTTYYNDNTLTLNSSGHDIINNLDSQLFPPMKDSRNITDINNNYILPKEYESIQKLLINLIQNCRQIGGKQYRNKMDDVERRLEQFFKNISMGKLQLTGSLFEHLQQCTLLAEQYNYPDALQQVNLLIQSASQLPDIQCFGPALKILMQTAKQLYPTSSSSVQSNTTGINSYPVSSSPHQLSTIRTS